MATIRLVELGALELVLLPAQADTITISKTLRSKGPIELILVSLFILSSFECSHWCQLSKNAVLGRAQDRAIFRDTPQFSKPWLDK